MTADKPAHLRELQNRCRNWLVMWSRWRRTYTAFAGFTSVPLIIDEADASRLLDQISKIEQTYKREMFIAGVG